MSLLLPDGRVLVGGGGAPGPQTESQCRDLQPAVSLRRSGRSASCSRGSLRRRPNIDIGETFFADFTDAADISRVTMVKTGVRDAQLEHGAALRRADVRALRLAAARAGADARGRRAAGILADVRARTRTACRRTRASCKINVASNWNPAITPTLANPGNQSTTVGDAASLQLVASDPNGDELGFGASGLPPGFTLDPRTGAISGTPSRVRQLQRRRRRERWSEHGDAGLRVDGARSGAAGSGAAAAARCDARRRRSNVHGGREQWRSTHSTAGTSTTARRRPRGRVDRRSSHTFTQPGRPLRHGDRDGRSRRRALADVRADRPSAAHRAASDGFDATSRSRPRGAATHASGSSIRTTIPSASSTP